MRPRRVGSLIGLVAVVALFDLACRRSRKSEGFDDEPPPAPPGAQQSAIPVRAPKLHRSTAERCTDLPTRRPTHKACRVDADCTGPEGRCEDKMCTEARCRVDDDCQKGQMCMCGIAYQGSQNEQPQNCLPAGCRIDADCGPGGFCSPSVDLACGHYRGVSGWFCHGPRDACVDDDDCVLAGPAGKPRRGYCSYSLVAGRFVCGFGGCAG